MYVHIIETRKERSKDISIIDLRGNKFFTYTIYMYIIYVLEKLSAFVLCVGTVVWKVPKVFRSFSRRPTIELRFAARGGTHCPQTFYYLLICALIYYFFYMDPCTTNGTICTRTERSEYFYCKTNFQWQKKKGLAIKQWTTEKRDEPHAWYSQKEKNNLKSRLIYVLYILVYT